MIKLFRKKLISSSTALFLFLALLTSCRGQPANDVTTNTYVPPVNEDGYIVVTLPIGSTKENSTFFWTSVAEGEDGGFEYTFTPEQFQKTKQAAYKSGRLIDAATDTYIAGFIRGTEYADIDEDGVPRTLVVSVDRGSYEISELTNSFLVTANASVYMRMYQIFCGVPDNEWAVEVTVKDADTGEIISEYVFPAEDGMGSPRNFFKTSIA